jgi:hypothetical protein
VPNLLAMALAPGAVQVIPFIGGFSAYAFIG